MRKHEIIADSQKQTDCGRWRGQASRGRRYHSQFYQSPHRLGLPSLSFFRFDGAQPSASSAPSRQTRSTRSTPGYTRVGPRGFRQKWIDRGNPSEKGKDFLISYRKCVFILCLNSSRVQTCKNRDQRLKKLPDFFELKIRRKEKFELGEKRRGKRRGRKNRLFSSLRHPTLRSFFPRAVCIRFMRLSSSHVCGSLLVVGGRERERARAVEEGETWRQNPIWLKIVCVPLTWFHSRGRRPA